MRILEPVTENENLAQKLVVFDLVNAKTQVFKCVHDL